MRWNHQKPMESQLVLIPSSKYVDDELAFEVGKIPPILIPVNGRPLLDSIIERYKTVPGKKHYYIIVNEGGELVAEHLKRSVYESEVKLVKVSKQADLGKTIESALKKIPYKKFNSMFINFGDTLVESEIDLKQDTIFYDDLNESFRWTTFEEIKGLLTKIVDKFVQDGASSHHTFSGLFHITKIDKFINSLENTASSQELGSFYSALMEYGKDQPLQLQKVKNWFDFGHVDNYYQSRKRFINKRYFNQVNVDEHRAIIKKTSSNVSKFLGEIRWYLELPAALRCYIPQVFDYSLDHKKPYICLEYYGYPLLAELLLFAGHSLGIWSHALDQVFRVTQDMQKYKLEEDPEKIDQALYEMYVTKTISRLSDLKKNPVLNNLAEKALVINKKQFSNLDFYISKIEDLYNRFIKNSLKSLSVIHGDLCLSNILYDPRSRIVKLVDPRGQFGPYAIYGDPRYEFAKLAHSFNGNYESIIRDRFFVICDDDRIEYKIFSSDYQHNVANLFNAKLSSLYPNDIQAIMFIEACLFLSMISLHSDHLNRQIMMLVTGIEKIDELLYNLN